MKAAHVRGMGQVLLLLSLAATGCRKEAPKPVEAGPDAPSGTPKIAVKQTVLDAGDVDYAIPRDFTFLIGNTGTAPLRLVLHRRSCSCGSADVPPQEIAPGREEAIKLHWKPIPGKTGPYTLAVDLATNDPQSPILRLEVKGQINPVVRILPDDWSLIDFNLIKPGEPASRELRLVSAKVVAFDLEVKASHPGLKTTVRKLPADAGGEFKCGYAVLVQTSPGLPRGYLLESLTLKALVPGEPMREIVMPVYGEVENGVFQVMPREVEFRKPRATEEDTQRVRVQFFVPSETEALEIVRCEPAFLSCSAPSRLRPGLWEFVVRLPGDNAAAAQHQADRFFEGRVLLRPSGSKDTVSVRVKWSPPDA